jgi:hypothetical protein
MKEARVTRSLKLMLQREPAAVGTLVASILPMLVLLGVIRIDEAGIAAVVVAVNATVGLFVRLMVTPVAAGPASPAPAQNVAQQA